jgi:hypothetical protein
MKSPVSLWLNSAFVRLDLQSARFGYGFGQTTERGANPTHNHPDVC